MRRLLRHLSVAFLGATTVLTVSARQQPAPPHTATFEILSGGAQLGSENVTMTDTGSGWTIASTGRLAAPVDLTTSRFEVTYTRDWQPQRLLIDGLSRGALFGISATFTETAATLVVNQSGQRKTTTHTVSPKTVVLPPNMFAAYEALAQRLAGAAIGARFPAYVTGDSELIVTLDAITPRRMTSPNGTLDLREFDVTFAQSAGAAVAEIWIDRDNHLAKFVLPGQGLAAIRNDLTSVMMREERIRHAGDESVFIPSIGFSLGATWTKPVAATGRIPVVVLVGSGVQDRDETIAGIPLFGQLAGALADAGYGVVRYDRRGSGQSGGRTEMATMTSYADDLGKVVDWLQRRKDVDGNRITVIGYGEGGSLALLAAARTKMIDGVVLMAANGTTGRQMILDLQDKELTRLGVADTDKTAKIALQRRVLDALITGKGWETIPADVRRATDTPWFKSLAQFDPAAALAKVQQPVLIVHGQLDRQVLPAEADRLEAAAKGRKPSPRTTTSKVLIPGVNHLFVPAKTGELEEYATLPVKTISPELTATLTKWMSENVVKK
jgi:pimeloyl-ACP methyl ester carboxylesterase